MHALARPAVLALALLAAGCAHCASDGVAETASGGSVAAAQEIAFDVEGMGCHGCAMEIEDVLRHEPGVADARVSFEEKKAYVVLDGSGASTLESLLAAVKQNREEHAQMEAAAAARFAPKE